MKKIIVLILSLVLALSLSVCAFATSATPTFDPQLDIVKSADGKTISVTMNDLPNGVSAELTIPCDGWSSATVKDGNGKVVKSTFGKTDINPDPDVEQMVNAVTFEAEGGTYTITKKTATTTPTTPSYPGYYYPVVTPDKDTAEKPAEAKPTTPAQPTTPPVVEDDVTPEPEDTTPVVPDEPPVIDDGAVDDAPAVDEPQGGNAGLWIGVGIVALAAIVAVLAIMAVRKKRK